ncbi:MAG: hypothetical protein H7177_00355 [Rhizobacter sp.]|nr:hypothetical protein [Bacteriovorax sp.]
MKTMIATKMKNLHRCLTFRQTALVTLTCLSISFSLSAEGIANTKSISRKPAAVEEEVLTVPLANDSIFTNEKIFAEDDAGVMKDMKANFNGWQATEDYAKKWGLQSTGLFNTPTTLQKTQYLRSKILRYADKRLSGEMRNAPEGTALHSMKTAETALRPNTNVNISKNFGFKFKLRVLQGKVIMDVKNPWIECNATINAKGKARIEARKEFKDIGLASGAEYVVNDAQVLTYIDQQVTDNVKARVSNTRATGAIPDSRLEMTASFPFNL